MDRWYIECTDLSVWQAFFYKNMQIWDINRQMFFQKGV